MTELLGIEFSGMSRETTTRRRFDHRKGWYDEALPKYACDCGWEHDWKQHSVAGQDLNFERLERQVMFHAENCPTAQGYT